MRATILLLEDLETKLVAAFTKFPLRLNSVDGEIYVVPPVYIGHEPPKKSGTDDSKPPFVIIKAIKGMPTKSQGKARVCEVKIGFMCAVYSKESESDIKAGYHDIFNMIERIMITLNNNFYYADNAWYYEDDAEWESGLKKATGVHEGWLDTQQPYFGATIECTFTAPSIDRPVFTGITR